MELQFIFNLLGTLPGSLAYHLLIFLGLLAAVGIIWTEWRQTRNAELYPYIVALSGTMTLQLLCVFLAPLHVAADSVLAILTAPLLYAADLLSLLLLFWAFSTPLWATRGRRVLMGLLVGWGILLGGMVAWWYTMAFSLPVTYNRSGQITIWYGLSALVGVAGAVAILRHRRESGSPMAAVAFGLTALGTAVGAFGTLAAGPDVSQTAEGLSRLVTLVGYPLFAVALYNATLKDLIVYRQELQAISEQALRQSQELLFLIEATRSIGESLDLSGMLGQVAESVAMALQVDRVAIFLAPPEPAETLTLVANYRVLGKRYSPSREVALQSYPILAFALRQHQVVFGIHEDFGPLRPLFALLEVERESPVLIQPLARQKQTLGLLVLCNDHSGTPFRAEQEGLITTIAVQIAGAVDNSRLYRALEAKARELALLLKAREEEVRRQEAILESMAEGILVSDADGRILLVNAAAEAILQTGRQRLRGRLVGELFKLSTLEGWDAQALTELNQPLQADFDLHERRLRIHAAPVQMKDGTRLGVVAILQDITRESLAEAAKREFIASISHELRTPLTAIKGYAELMLFGMAGKVHPVHGQFLSVIRENTVRMTSLSDNLISVAELERGQLGLAYQWVPIPPLVEEVLGRYKERIAEHQLQLTVDLAPDLPSVEVDPHRVKLVLDNLVNNAVRFTYPGGALVVGSRPIQDELGQPGYVSLWVSDTGVGIPLDEQPRIWERFYRVDNPLSLEAGGLGVGLTIAKALVEAHGGRIWVDSSPGQGSTFTALLPVRRRHPLEKEQEGA